MKTLFTWKRGDFSNTFNLFRGGEEAGHLTLETWRSGAEAALGGRQFKFIKQSFWTFTTDIFEQDQPQPVGCITYNLWGNRANLVLSMSESHRWQYENLWQTKWQFASPSGSVLQYVRTGGIMATEGAIVADYEPKNLLVLTGLYIHAILARQAAAVTGA
ncbi:MAG: hypothetical protein LH606_22520 [Cytophagaceae bacterium]|nr:hypothetical protein [Cytophagaceae bacterium]